jgi:hypothetical protein
MITPIARTSSTIVTKMNASAAARVFGTGPVSTTISLGLTKWLSR